MRPEAKEQRSLQILDKDFKNKKFISMSDQKAIYAAAAQALLRHEPETALRLAKWLVLADMKNPNYWQLQGLCYHHLKQYILADSAYEMAKAAGYSNVAEILIYQGEVKLFLAEKDLGLQLLRQGLSLAQNKPDPLKLTQRAQNLLAQFGDHPIKKSQVGL